MKSIGQITAISIPLALSYVYLSTPTTSEYSFHAFFVSIIVYILLKHLNQARILPILSNSTLDEIVFIGFSFHLLIGGTGGISSYFFFLNYIYIFFLAFFCTTLTSFLITLEIIIFYNLLNPSSDLNSFAISALISLPMNLMLSLFAKKQYNLAHKIRT